MNSRSISNSLAGCTVGISGAVPTPAERQEQQISEFDIHATVRRLAERILGSEGHLVYGSHPTFTPVIERVCFGLGPSSGPRVTMLMARRYFKPGESIESWDAYERRHGRYAEVIPIGNFGDERQQALTSLREELAKRADALICLGGRSHKEDGQTPGVEEEMRLARGLDKPVYLLGGFGGHTAVLFNRYRKALAVLGNTLSESDNVRLGTTKSIGDAVELVMQGLLQRTK